MLSADSPSEFHTSWREDTRLFNVVNAGGIIRTERTWVPSRLSLLLQTTHNLTDLDLDATGLSTAGCWIPFATLPIDPLLIPLVLDQSSLLSTVLTPEGALETCESVRNAICTAHLTFRDYLEIQQQKYHSYRCSEATELLLLLLAVGLARMRNITISYSIFLCSFPLLSFEKIESLSWWHYVTLVKITGI